VFGSNPVPSNQLRGTLEPGAAPERIGTEPPGTRCHLLL